MDDDFNQFKTRQANKIKAIQQSRLSANQKQQLTEQELDKLRARKVAENNQLKKKLDELAQNTKNPQVLAKIQQINAEADRRMAQDRLKVEGELTKDTQTSIVQDIQKVQIDPTTGQVKTKDTIDVTKLSPGEKKRDETFAKQYTDFSSSKGLPVVEKNLARLRAAKEDLQRRIDEGDTGDDRFYGRLPDVFKFEEDISLRDAVHSSAVGALRATLGAQFTEKEGTRIMNQSFNETLSAKENLKRVQLALDELESGKEGMIDQGKYFEQYGTLKGYKLPTNKKTQPTKTESKRQYNAKLDMTRIIYDDGSMEELPGKQIKK